MKNDGNEKGLRDDGSGKGDGKSGRESARQILNESAAFGDCQRGGEGALGGQAREERGVRWTKN